jgi:hypothetical protein
MQTQTERKLAAARAKVRTLSFGTDAWEAAMVTVRALTEQVNAERAPEEFFSVDSGEHRTRLIAANGTRYI